MVSFYGFEYDWNEFLGVSILSNPMELIGLVIIVIALIFTITLTRTTLKSYRENKDPTFLAWFLAFLFLTLAVIFLILEKVSYSTLGKRGLGDIFAVVAFMSVSVALVSFNNFTFRMTFPERVTILTVFIVILAVAYSGILTYAIFGGHADVIQNELVYDPTTDLLVYLTLLPILVTGPTTFFYFFHKTLEENRPNSLRSLWMGIGFTSFGVGYLVEVAPILPTEYSIPLRSLFVAAAFIMYVCFTMPQWFKTRIGWTE